MNQDVTLFQLKSYFYVVTEIVEKISYQREDGALVEATSYKTERIGFQGKYF